MGIRKLTAQLRPLARPIFWDPSDPDYANYLDGKEEPLIIDGPSLAHHVYSRCVRQHANVATALEAFPTYAELGLAIVEWLEQVERFALVGKIFFDGFLPGAKAGTREERLQQSLNLLEAYRSDHKDLHLPVAGNVDARQPLGQVKRVPRRLDAIPRLPFLVPAVLDALFLSKYRDRTFVVPYEADIACAAFADCCVDAIILTNDSDLLLYRHDARVMFFSDLDFESGGCSSKVLKGLCFHPRAIAQELTCDLIKLGFFIKNDSHMQLKTCADKARRDSDALDADEAFKTFASEYVFHAKDKSHLRDTINAGVATPLGAVLARLDPRVSEFVQQWIEFATSEGIPGAYAEPTTLTAFLPFLVDDPTRASAWKPSGYVRQLAYSILAICCPHARVIEMDRRGERVVPTTLQIFTFSELLTNSMALLQSLDSAENGDDNKWEEQDRRVSYWRSITLLCVLKSVAYECAPLPTKHDVLQLVAGKPNKMSWSILHVYAQVEAFLYSCRMLQQIVAVYIAACRNSEDTVNGECDLFDNINDHHRPQIALTKGLPMEIAERLQAKLDRLPSLQVLLTRPGDTLPVKHGMDRLEQQLDSFYAASIEGGASFHGKRGQSRRRAKRKGHAASGSATNTGETSAAAESNGNTYAVLDER